MPNEADTWRRLVVPRLLAAGWDAEPRRINEQVTFTDGRIIVTRQRSRRRPGKRADYILRRRSNLPNGVPTARKHPCYCAEHGAAQIVVPDILELLPISQHSVVIEVARFGD